MNRPASDTATPKDPRDVRTMTFEEFFHREYVAMVCLAKAITMDSAEAEDITQVAMAKAHEQWSKLSTYDNPGAWLRRVTINQALSARRHSVVAKKAELRMLDGRTVEPTAAEARPFENDPDLFAAIASLPERQRVAIALHYLEDRPVSEIAALMGCSSATARVHLHRGRTAIARTLEALR